MYIYGIKHIRITKTIILVRHITIKKINTLNVNKIPLDGPSDTQAFGIQFVSSSRLFWYKGLSYFLLWKYLPEK